tara:strand:- start:195507 stop:196238 length:732 start_codon:yes stop_codon:yes gene_type:complete
MVKIAAISDTHNWNEEISIPKCDILVHSGDWTNKGTYSEVYNFIHWFSTVEGPTHRVCIAGNHDFLPQTKSDSFKEILDSFPNIHYLQDSSVELCGLKIYGLPWSPFFYDWAFNALENRDGQGLAYKGGPGHNATADSDHPWMKSKCDLIPADTNILLCHSPPRLGEIDRMFGKTALGSEILAATVANLSELKAGFYGHIHSARKGKPFELNGATHYNACSCDEAYEPVYAPLIVEIDNEESS